MAAPKVDWFAIQEQVFTRWCNDELKRRGMKINSMKDDLKNGLILINLMEIISGKSLGRYNKHPRIISQKLENLNIALNFIKSEGIKLVNVGSDDIHTGNMRIILGLIWTLILRYEIKRGSDGNDKDATDDLLKWVQSKIPEYNITGWRGKDWNDGKAVCALCEAVRPGTYPQHASLDPNDKYANCKEGITAGETIGVDPLILPEELCHPKVDKLALMTYIAQFRNLPENVDQARLCSAYGPGLVEGVVNEDANFNIDTPPGCPKPVVRVEGPVDDAPVNLTDLGDGKYAVSYKPTTPGHYKVHVTVNGNHIPGSTFHVRVLEQESLGGEGMIRVFYSTTSSSQKGRSDFRALQTLFEGKRVHLRKDFEPWVAVDLLEKDDREAIFRKAGTRTLPIVFVDDQYRGDYDKMRELEEMGKLDDLLNMRRASLISEEQHFQRLRNMPAEGDMKNDEDNQDVNQVTSGVSNLSTGAAPAAATSANKFCGNCGTKSTGNKFCGNCGSKL